MKRLKPPLNVEWLDVLRDLVPEARDEILTDDALNMLGGVDRLWAVLRQNSGRLWNQ